jgi:ABC-type sugar transport system ATPase subunit
MKVLSGVYPHGTYDGTIVFEGQPCQFKDIRESEHAGIVIIHQELALIPELSITENIFLGNEITRRGRIDWAEARRRATELLARVGLREDPDTQIKHIGVGKQQLVEIAKALSKSVRLLILDEPTAAPRSNRSPMRSPSSATARASKRWMSRPTASTRTASSAAWWAAPWRTGSRSGPRPSAMSSSR